MKEEQNMKHTMRILTFLMLAIVVGTGQVWADALPDLGHIVFDESVVTGGKLEFYKDAECTIPIAFTNGKSADISSEGMDGDNTIGYMVYIKALPDGIHTVDDPDFITIEKTTSVFHAPRRTSETIPIPDDIDVNKTSKLCVYSFAMPANGANVTIKEATFEDKEKVNVEYPVDYIGADGMETNTGNKTVYILDGTETTLGQLNANDEPVETWYYLEYNDPNRTHLTYANSLTLISPVHLILCDGMTMEITDEDTSISGGTDASLTIYDQGNKINDGEVSFICRGKINIGGDLVINGGHHITCGENYYGAINAANIVLNSRVLNNQVICGDNITASGNLTINRGHVEAGRIMATGNLTINSGQIEATTIGATTGNLLLSWNKADDYIHADSYEIGEGKTISIPSGRSFVIDNDDSDTELIGTIEDPLSINGSTLVPGYVSFYDYNGSEQKLRISDNNVHVLDGTEEALSGNSAGVNDDERVWTVVAGNLNYDDLSINNPNYDEVVVNLVLADHASLSFPTNYGINGYGSLNIYAHEDGQVIAANEYGIIDIWGDLTIYGGKITSTISATDDYNKNSIRAANVTIYSGQVEATGYREGHGIDADIITLGWTKANDHIQVSSYYGTVKTLRGRGFRDEDNTDYHGTIAKNIIDSENNIYTYDIDGKKLMPGSIFYRDAVNQWQELEKGGYTLLDGNQTELAADVWYVVSGNVAYSDEITSGDNVNLILADHSEMKTSEDIEIGGALTIYGQGGKTEGRLVAAPNLDAADFTLYGGHVEAASIEAKDDDASADINIFGGQVETVQMIAGNNITLGWTKATDYIQTGSYSVGDEGKLTTVRGRGFIDEENNEIYGTFLPNLGNKYDIDGKTLIPGSVGYIAANGKRQMLSLSKMDRDELCVTLLTGEEETLIGHDADTETAGEAAETPVEDYRKWFVVSGHVDFDNMFDIQNGIVNLVLADGAEMTFNGEVEKCITGSSELRIYGQGGESEGQITANVIDVSEFILYGGHIEATKIEATDVTIYGGQVETEEMKGYDITLGWRKGTDYVTAYSYSIGENGVVSIVPGKSFTAVNPTNNEVVKEDLIGQISGFDLTNYLKANKLIPGGISYIAANGKRQMLSLSKKDGDELCVTLLTGEEETLNGHDAGTETEGEADPDQDYRKWFVVSGHVDYDHLLNINGNIVNLVLADGAEMTFDEEIDNCITGDSELRIYGQGGKTEGKISANGFSVGDFTMYGGHVETTNDAIYAYSGDVTIYGGQIVADGINAKKNITLGWTKGTDYIKSSSYIVGNEGILSTVPGKGFVKQGEDDDIVMSTTGIKDVILVPGSISFVDGDGTEHQLLRGQYTLLTGEEEILDGNSEDEEAAGETATNPEEDDRQWFVASGNVTYNSPLGLYGDVVHLILADRAQMTVEGEDNGINGISHLIVYSQGANSVGALTVAGDIDVNDFTMYGGQIEVNGNIDSPVTLGWTNEDEDYIKATYTCYNDVKIKEGQAFVDESGKGYASILSQNQVTTINDKKLTPSVATQLFAKGAKHWWMTWCSPKEYFIPALCQVYTIDTFSGNGYSVSVSEVEGDVIPAYTPVLILRNSDDELTEGICAAYNENGNENEKEAIQKDDDFWFIGNPADEATETGSLTGAKHYILYDNEFVMVDTDEGIPAHRCVLKLNDQVLSAPRLSIVIDGETTSLASMEDVRCKMEDVWYTLDGRKLQGKPTKKGLYIHNGRKVVIK